jgi:hypothetical protein
MDIGALIQSSRFRERDIEFGTEGQCASFALALHDVLGEMGRPSRIHVIADHDYLADTYRFWSHVVVVHEDSMYDIRGLVSMHDNRMFGAYIFPISPGELRDDITDLKRQNVSLYDCRDRYATWKRMLSRTQQPKGLSRNSSNSAQSTQVSS